MKLRPATLILTLLLVGLPAGAQSVGEIVDQLELRRYYLDQGVEAPVNDMEQLVTAYPQVSFVALGDEWEEGADALAADLLAILGDGTYFVRTPEEIGTVSSEYDDAALNAALDVVVATSGSDYLIDFEEFAGALEAIPPGGGLPIGWILLVGVGGAVAFFVWRGRRQRTIDSEDRLQEARNEIRSQMDVVANQILAMADDPRIDNHPQAREHFRVASEIFQAAEGRLEGVTNLGALEDLSDDLDLARWELEAGRAVTEGREPPPKPVDEKPPHCFFDPTHGAGTEQAELKTPAGSQQVWVCAADADKLRRGEAPQPRTIPMEGGQIPAPRAPRSHGGMGLDWLDVFSVIVGGMGSGLPYDWSGQRPPTRRSGGRLSFPSRPGGISTPRPSRPARPKGRARRRL
ncbi:MAG TPA: hypothetical protein VM470_01695 [Acidimicrobiia bacterium]|nr:hypothetical protein [Acidimicrobiia bacterium]